MTTPYTIIGNLTSAPEVRFTPSGAAVASFTIADTPRKFNKDTNAWEDGETLFMRCSLWRDAAEQLASSLGAGCRVIATGMLKQRKFTDNTGAERVVIEMDVDEIGPSLKWATAVVSKAQKGGGGAAQRPTQHATDSWGHSGSGHAEDVPPF